MGAFLITLSGETIVDARCGFGGMAAIPKRAKFCEAALINQPLTEHTMTQAAHQLSLDFEPIDDARASAEYRMEVAQNLLQKLLIELTQIEHDHATRVTDHDME